jgi:nucleotidyltransferase substrate binding protein (TIGR01987 family)
MKNDYASNKLSESIDKLKHSLTFENKIHHDDFYFSGIAKSFEICLEYAWKHFKRVSLIHGLEANSPREAIKNAHKLKLINDLDLWLGFLEDRNYAVHDYLRLSMEDYLETIHSFYKAIKKLKLD